MFFNSSLLYLIMIFKLHFQKMAYFADYEINPISIALELGGYYFQNNFKAPLQDQILKERSPHERIFRF